MPFQVLVHHRHNTNREITCNTATNLEKAYALSTTVVAVPIGQPNHVFDATFHGGGLHFIFDDIGGKDVTHGAVFPATHNDGEVAFSSSNHPAVFGVDFIISLHHTAV